MIQYIKNEQVWDGGAINIPSYTTSTPTDDEMILGGYHKETPKATEENPEPQEGWYDAEGNEYAGEEITIPEMTMFSPQPADLIANGYEAVEIEEPALTEEELLEKAKLNKIQQIVAYDRSSNDVAECQSTPADRYTDQCKRSSWSHRNDQVVPWSFIYVPTELVEADACCH